MSQFGNLGGMMSMFNNPQFMNMATQLMSDPQMQNVYAKFYLNFSIFSKLNSIFYFKHVKFSNQYV
jgi:hypothetical protein